MLALILRRVLIGVPTILGVTVVLFLALRVLPGDPVSAVTAGAPTSAEAQEALRLQFGLDQPLWLQYLKFVGDAFTLDLGTSYASRQPVLTMIGQQIGPTLQLAVAAAAVSAAVGILLGTVAAVWRNRWPDALIRTLSLIGTAMPSFWVGLILLMAFSFTLPIFPATGSGGLRALVLPALALGLSAAGTVTRLVRNSMLELMGETFVDALYAKGLTRRQVVVGHVLRNAIIPTVTIVGLQLGALIAGAVVVETVFARRGIGQMLVQGVSTSDFPVIQGVVLVIAVLYVLINIVVDVSYSVIDPRIRVAVGKG